jgi:hypothetical protein
MAYAVERLIEVLRYKPEMRESLGIFLDVILPGSTQHGCLLEVRVAGA